MNDPLNAEDPPTDAPLSSMATPSNKKEEDGQEGQNPPEPTTKPGQEIQQRFNQKNLAIALLSALLVYQNLKVNLVKYDDMGLAPQRMLTVSQLQAKAVEEYDPSDTVAWLKENAKKTDREREERYKNTKKRPKQQQQQRMSFNPENINKKIAVYMTTHLSKEHKKFLEDCWPSAVRALPLLQQADLIVYTSSWPQNDYLFYNLKKKFSLYDESGAGFNEVTINRYDPVDHQEEGTMAAMIDPFYEMLPQQKQKKQRKKKEKKEYTPDDSAYKLKNQTLQWFDGYDWVIKLNPDVLIRRDHWLLQTMASKDVDAVFNKPRWGKDFAFTDFYAFRPKAINHTALLDTYIKMKRPKSKVELSPERHLFSGFKHIWDYKAGRRRTTQPNCVGRHKLARTVGPGCDVVHSHDLVKHCPNYFEATDGKWY